MIITCDTLVIGSGISGLNFALLAASHGRVAIITKKELMESNSSYAQGGIAAVLDEHDSMDAHIRDTMETGCGHGDLRAIQTMIQEGPTQIQRLINLGVGFNQHEGKLCLTQEANHSARRIAHVNDATGREIERALLHAVREHDNIETFESHMALDLILDKGRCIGAQVLNAESKKVEVFYARSVALATGGAAQVYARNCNPKIATGDGIAMAARAGAKIKDMEFIQFHPTALAKAGAPTFLISETIRGEGGILKNKARKAFMTYYDARGDMAPRDIVSRAIFHEMKRGTVYLDIRHKGSAYIKKRFPYIYNQLWWYGIKMDKQMIPVAPAAHYTCGGVHTDLYGKTDVPGLFAFGEVAHTGVHGANRLASNSLLECMVFSSRAARSVVQYNKKNVIYKKKVNIPKYIKKIDPSITRIKTSIKKIMWQYVGIIRTPKNLQNAKDTLITIHESLNKKRKKGIGVALSETCNLSDIALLITYAAIERTTSLGTHYIQKDT